MNIETFFHLLWSKILLFHEAILTLNFKGVREKKEREKKFKDKYI